MRVSGCLFIWADATKLCFILNGDLTSNGILVYQNRYRHYSLRLPFGGWTTKELRVLPLGFMATTIGKPMYDLPLVNLEKILAGTETTALSYFYFQLFWLEWVDQELKKVPNAEKSIEQLWIAADTENNLGCFSNFVSLMRELSKRKPDNETLKLNYEFYKNTFKFNGPEWKLKFY